MTSHWKIGLSSDSTSTSRNQRRGASGGRETPSVGTAAIPAAPFDAGDLHTSGAGGRWWAGVGFLLRWRVYLWSNRIYSNTSTMPETTYVWECSRMWRWEFVCLLSNGANPSNRKLLQRKKLQHRPCWICLDPMLGSERAELCRFRTLGFCLKWWTEAWCCFF